jgi:hypothetical protein
MPDVGRVRHRDPTAFEKFRLSETAETAHGLAESVRHSGIGSG